MSKLKNQSRLSLFVYLLFLATGSCGLIYQVVWQRYLLNIFGSTIYSISTVLAAFMGGLALGSGLMAIYSPRLRRNLAVYGCLEIIVGLAALAIPFMLGLLDPLFTWAYREFGSNFTFFSLLRFVFISLILLVPTTMMGATLPLLSNFVAPGRAGAGLKVGLLYTLNTWGAVIGAFCAGFFLLPAFGVSHTVYLAVGINILCGLLAFVLSWRIETNVGNSSGPVSQSLFHDDLQVDADEKAKQRALWVIVTYAVSGFVALGLEVAWTRALVFSFEFLKNTTYAFTGMLTTFLAGLALGSAVMSGFVERIKRPFQLFALLQLFVGLSAILSVFILFYITPSITDALLAPYDAKTPGGVRWIVSLFDVFIKTGLSMLLPTFIMGLAFPVAVKAVVGEVGKTARSVGKLYSFNTVGAIAGSFLVGFVLLPGLGICRTIFLLGAMQLIMGVALLYKSPQTESYRRYIWTGAGVLVLVVCAFRLPSQAHFQRDTVLEKVIFYKEGPLATVSVGENSLGYRTIYVDNVGVAGTDPMLLTDQKSLAHVPMLMLENPKSILSVGFGSGGASYSYTLYPELENIHCIEITKTVVEASPYLVDSHRDVVMNRDMYKKRTGRDLAVTGGIPLFEGKSAWDGWYKSDPRYKILLDDARSYLHFTDFKYDVIATDCTDLRYKSNANLYDLEYFRLCRDRITDDGMVVVWMPMGGLSPEAFNCALETFRQVFPNMDVFFMNNQPTHYVLLLGKKGPIKVNLETLCKRIARPQVARDLAEIQLEQPEKLLSCFVTGCAAVEPLLAGSELNTSDNPYLEFESPRYGIADAPVLDNLDSLFRYRENPVRLIANADQQTSFVASLAKYFEAAPHVIKGHRAYREMRLTDSCREYMAAQAITPDDSSLKELLNYEDLRRRIRAKHTDMWARLQLCTLLAMQNRDAEAVTECSSVLSAMGTFVYGDKQQEIRDRREILTLLLELYRRNNKTEKVEQTQALLNALK